MKLTYYGHSCIGIETEGIHLLVDPFITENPLANNINIDNIKADYILVTHAHQDHVGDVERIAKRTGAKLISNFEIVEHFFEVANIEGHPMNLGGSYEFPFGHLRYVTALHSSTFQNRMPGGNPGGFILRTSTKTIYISGDTALNFDMNLIPLRYNLDLSVFPIGGNFTMDIEDAIMASDFVKCDKILGVHYDTFGYIKINHQEAIDEFKERNKQLLLPKIGETLYI